MSRPHSFLAHAAPMAALALALFLLLGFPQAAAAHAALVRAEPGVGEVLTAPPSEVHLWFSEPTALDFSTVQVVDRARKHYETGPLSHPNNDQTALRIALLPDLPSGTYTVLTHVVSAADGHLTEERFAFIVRRAGEPTPTPGAAEPLPPDIQPGPDSGVPTTTVADVSPVRWLVRALALIMAAWLLGGPLFTVLVLEPALAPLPALAGLLAAAQRRWGRLGILAAILLLLFLGADMLFQVGELAGVAPLDALGQGAVLGRFVGGTSYGLYWALRVGAAVVLGAVCIWLARSRRIDVAVWSVGVAAAGLVFAGEALSSHPAATAPIGGLPIGTLSDLVHLMAAGAWVGGLLYLAVILLPLVHAPAVAPALRFQALGRVVPRFSTLALLSVGLLIITGFVNVVLRTTDLDAIVASSYGQTLMVKHLLFLPLLALGAAQNRRMTPRLVRLLAGAGTVDGPTGAATVSLFQRLIRIEVLLTSAVLLCAAGLTLLPPPATGNAVITPPLVLLSPVPITPIPTPAAPPTLTPTPMVASNTQTVAGLEIGLTVQPDLAGDQFTVRLRRSDGTPLNPADVRTQMRVAPQDVNSGSTELALSAAASLSDTLTYTATEPILTLSGSYEARVVVSQRQGNDAKAAFRMVLGDDGSLSLAPSPYIQAAVITDPSPAMSGTVGLDLRLTDGQGAPVAGATVLILPMMPAHGHIEPQETAAPVAGTPGLYHTSAKLQMGGGWLMIITITPPGGSPVTVRTDASFDVTDPLATPTPAGGGLPATPTSTQ